MALARIKTWSAGEVLTASDLNSEFNNILGNALSLISPLTGALDLDGNSLTLDAAAVTSVVSSTAVSWNFTSGAKTGTPATTGSVANWAAQTFTDSATAGSGTATAFVAHAFQRPTLASTNASVTTTSAATVYIANAPAAGTNETITNAYALWVDNGITQLDGAANVGGDLTVTSNLLWLSGTAFAGTLDHANTAARTWAYPDASGTLLIDTGGANWNSRLINGNWLLDQTNEGALYTVNTTDVRGPDGWSGSAVGAGVFKLRTLADPDNAALKCLEITCTTADAAIVATDNYFVYTAVEGYDSADLQPGVSTAASITIKFKFKTNITGVYGISVANSATNRSYVAIITVASTSETEYITTLTLDTAGTWLYTNGVGLYMRIALASGSNFQTTAGSWAANNMFTTSAQCNFMSANTNISYLKRVALVPGSVALAYGPPDIQKELAKAQRQYYKSTSQGVLPSAGTAQININGYTVANQQKNIRDSFPVTMRAAPSLDVWDNAGTFGSISTLDAGGVFTNGVAVAASQVSDRNMIVYAANGVHTGLACNYAVRARLS